MSDLVELLRLDADYLRKMMAQAKLAGPQTAVRVKSPVLLLESIEEAADRITALEKENAELRKALEPFANSDMAPDIYDDDSCVAGSCDFTCSDLRRARYTMEDIHREQLASARPRVKPSEAEGREG